MVILVPFLVALAGLVLYLGLTSPKLAEAARCAWWVGLLVGLLEVGRSSVSILH